MRSVAVLAVVLVMLCLAPHAATGKDGSAVVTTVFNLYGSSVEPFDDSKMGSIKKALVQSAGHGVTDGDVDVSVVTTYTDQQKGRRLLQDGRLVQPGVQLQAETTTTAQSAPDVASSIDNALRSNQIAQIYNANGGQADYTSVVTASSAGSSSGGTSTNGDSSSNGGGQVVNGDSGNSSSGKKSGFPSWVIAVIVVLVLLLVALVAGYFIWRKCAARRAIRAQEFDAAGYFSNAKPSVAPVGGSGGGSGSIWDKAKGLGGGIFRARSKSLADTPAGTISTPSMNGTGGLLRNPQTPFSTIGFTGAGASSSSPPLTTFGSPPPGSSSPGTSRYSGFARTTSGGATPKGSSLPTASPLYTPPPSSGSPYVPTRAGRLMDTLRS